MKTRFYLIRHGETEMEFKKVFIKGLTDIPLSEEE